MDNLNSELQQQQPGVDVSVIIPIYNAHDYLDEALKSILAQDFESFEVICVDDGSTDRSLDIIKKYKEISPKIRIITENNAGPATARNKGLSRVRGKYVIFLDADDFYEPTLISSLYSAAENLSLDIAVANFDIYNTRRARFEHNIESDHFDLLNDGRVVSKNEYPDYILQCATGYVWNKMFKRDFLLENGIAFNTSLRIFEDVYFVTTAFATASRISKVPEVLVHHRIYSEQSRPKMFKKYYTDVPVVYEEIKKFLMHRGAYAPIATSFMNLSASRCYKIYNILWKDAKETFWNLLHEKYSQLLGWGDFDPSEVENPHVRSFIASVSLYTHKQFVKRKKSLAVNEDSYTEQKFERKKALGRYLDIFRLRKR